MIRSSLSLASLGLGYYYDDDDDDDAGGGRYGCAATTTTTWRGGSGCWSGPDTRFTGSAAPDRGPERPPKSTRSSLETRGTPLKKKDPEMSPSNPQKYKHFGLDPTHLDFTLPHFIPSLTLSKRNSHAHTSRPGKELARPQKTPANLPLPSSR